MGYDGNLKRELFSLLAWHMHRHDRHPGETLQRLLSKCADADLDQYDIILREAKYPLRHLIRIRGKGHGGAEPKREDTPLILLSHRGIHVLDGQNRINKWSANDNQGPHRVIIITLRKRREDTDNR